jgi:hypothetical protein
MNTNYQQNYIYISLGKPDLHQILGTNILDLRENSRKTEAILPSKRGF